jgi:hypothetical protein
MKNRKQSFFLREEKMRPHLFLVLSLFLILLYSSSASDETEYILKLDGNDFTLKANGKLYPIALDDVKDFDTGRVMDTDTLYVCGTDDTLVIPASTDLVPIKLNTPSRAISLFIWFDYTKTKIDEYTELLRQYNKFGRSSTAGFGDFKYSSYDDSNLAALNHKFNLDSIAGDGGDVERAINLMRWAHGIVRHNGSSYNPSPRNALNIIRVCADSGRGVNCRMIATILNEACLAVGLKARHLTCMPGDSTDNDCHVVDMIWSDSLNKWVMLDPTFRAYFENADGEILGPLDVRDAYINGDLPVLNDDIDRNGSPYNAVQYRSYMAKNLFRFLTPIESSFGYESRTGDVSWVYLYPTGYRTGLVGTADSTVKETGLQIDCHTDNAAWFWEE